MKHTSHTSIDRLLFEIKTESLSEERLAKEAVLAYMQYEEHCFATYAHLSDYARALKQTKDLIVEHSKEHTVLKNCLHILFPDKDILKFQTMKELRTHMRKQGKILNRHFEEIIVTLPKIGADKIKEGSVIFTFGHEADIINILLHAHVQNKKFTVVNIEHRPSYSGKLLAETLGKHGISVVHHVDLAMRQAMKKADLVLIGCDAINYHGEIYGEIGSELVCEVAESYHVPVYVCCDSYRYDPSLTQKAHLEKVEHATNDIWEKPPKNVTVHNYTFEKIKPTLVSGIICELGIIDPQKFVFKIKENTESYF